MAQPHIFVSYSHQDSAFAQRLVDDLQKAGAQVWYDVSGIDYGNFMKRLDEALTQCEWMVLVLTPSAIASEYVTEEVYTALHRVKQGYMRAVIPVLAAPFAPGTIPPQWDVVQRYDATQDYAGALARVLRAVGLASAAVGAALPTPVVATPSPPDAASLEAAAAPSAPEAVSPTPDVVSPTTGSHSPDAHRHTIDPRYRFPHA